MMIAIVILSSCIGCDQATKTMATQTLQDKPPKSYLADTVRLSYALNPGGFLSFGSGLPDQVRTVVFIALNSCLLAGICVFLYVKRNVSTALFVSLVLVLAGGIGNLIDRLSNHGLVTDFLNVGIGSLRTGVFNVADMAVMFGAMAVGYLTIRHRSDEQKMESDEKHK